MRKTLNRWQYKISMFPVLIMFLIGPDLSGQNIHWVNQVVETGSSVMGPISLKINSEGYPRIAYRESENGGKIKYASYNGSKWEVEFADETLFMGAGKVVLTLDKNDNPHIFYHATDGLDIKYAYKNGQVWNHIIVDTGLRQNSYYWVSAVATSSGVNFLGYTKDNGAAEQIAFNTAKKDTIGELVWVNPNAGTSGKWNDIELDENEEPYFAFFQDGVSDLKFGYRVAGEWQNFSIEENDASINQGYFPSMEYAQNTFYIAFQDHTNDLLKFATGNTTNWQVETIKGLGGATTFSSNNTLKRTDNGDMYIAFCEYGEKDLEFLFKTGGGQWQSKKIDSVGFVGEYNSMELVDGTLPVIAYLDRTNKQLKVAWGFNGPPSDQDSDLLPDILELQLDTNPLDKDTDDDGIPDGLEDKNLNGVVDENETNPLMFDTDSDSLSDGLEIGLISYVEDPDGTGPIEGTNPLLFQMDLDTSTTTNPHQADSDNDGLIDGDEDVNRNGRLDVGDSDPNKKDSDGDLLDDKKERDFGSDPLDVDGDDDGLSDGQEDKNLNGKRDPNETSPALADTDFDGVDDGTELGITVGIADPDGDGILKGTDLAFFKADEDITYNSNPVVWDSDGDGLGEGEEDTNLNGKVDAGETDFLIWDNDSDGLSDGDEFLFRSDPLDGSSIAHIDTLVDENFNGLAELPEGWLVFDEGTMDAPSLWLPYDNGIAQGTNIHDEPHSGTADDPFRAGTYIILGNMGPRNFKLNFRVRSNNFGEIGIIFNYLNPDNHYSFTMNREYSYARLVQKDNGVSSTIAWKNFKYETSTWYPIRILSNIENVRVFIGEDLIVKYEYPEYNPGLVGFYTWKNPLAVFDDIQIVTDSSDIVNSLPDQQMHVINEFSYISKKAKGRLLYNINNYIRMSHMDFNIIEEDGSRSLIKRIQFSGRHTDNVSGSLDIVNPRPFARYELSIYALDGRILDSKITTNNNTGTSFYIYPNPISEIFKVAFQNPSVGKIKITAYDILGRRIEIFEKNITSSGIANVQFNFKKFRELSNGLYFLDIVYKDDRTGKILMHDMQKFLLVK